MRFLIPLIALSLVLYFVIFKKNADGETEMIYQESIDKTKALENVIQNAHDERMKEYK